MKEWFKYEFGYVNIDSENLFFTSSGNWSETKTLQEKAIKNKTTYGNSSQTLFFLILIICIFLFMIYKRGFDGTSSITLIIVLASIFYKVYEYLKTEIGEKFKIPREKIKAIEIKDYKVEISFLNYDGNIDFCKITGLDQSALLIMERLKNQL